MKTRLKLRFFSVIVTVFIAVTSSVIGASAAAETFEEYIVKNLTDFAEKIDISAYQEKNGWTADQAVAAFQTTVRETPELFFVASQLQYSRLGKTTVVMPKYSMTKKNAQSAQSRIDKAADTFLAQIDDDMTKLEKIFRLHNWLADTIKYDHATADKTTDLSNVSDETPFNIVGAFLEKDAVCQGYALAFLYLCEKMDIECIYIVSKDHAWNMVKLGSKWYHIDVTWDDGDDRTNGNDVITIYDYFLVSDKLVNKGDASHRKWTRGDGTPAPAAGNTYDDAFWQKTGSRSTLPIIDHSVYYLLPGKDTKYTFKRTEGATTYSSNFSYKTTLFRRTDLSTGKTYAIAELDFPKLYKEEDLAALVSGKYYYVPDFDSNIAAKDSRVYFHTSGDLFYYDLTTKKIGKLSRPADIVNAPDEYYISGLGFSSNGNLVYYLTDSNRKITVKTRKLAA